MDFAPKRVARVVVAVLAGCALFAFLVFCVAVVIGFRPEVIRGASMEPALERGTLLLVRPVAPERLRLGDIVSFEDPRPGRERLVTHRVVGIERYGPQAREVTFRTRGDANRKPDPWHLSVDDRIGRKVIAVPAVGRLGLWLRRPWGWFVVFLTPAALLALSPLAGRESPLRASPQRSG